MDQSPQSLQEPIAIELQDIPQHPGNHSTQQYMSPSSQGVLKNERNSTALDLADSKQNNSTLPVEGQEQSSNDSNSSSANKETDSSINLDVTGPSEKNPLISNGKSQVIGGRQQNGTSAITPLYQVEAMNAQHQAKLIEIRINGGFCCYSLMNFASLIFLAFDLHRSLKTVGQVNFVIAFILFFFSILAIVAKYRFDTKKQFVAMVAFWITTILSALYAVSGIIAENSQLLGYDRGRERAVLPAVLYLLLACYAGTLHKLMKERDAWLSKVKVKTS